MSTPILFGFEGIRVKPLIEGESLPTSKNPLTAPENPKLARGIHPGQSPKQRIPDASNHRMVSEWRCCQLVDAGHPHAGIATLFKRIPTEVFPEFELDMITVSVPYRVHSC